MSDWPTERIWTDGHDIYTESYAAEIEGYTEYIRADIADQRIKELEESLQFANETNYKTLLDAANLIIEMREARITELEQVIEGFAAAAGFDPTQESVTFRLPVVEAQDENNATDS